MKALSSMATRHLLADLAGAAAAAGLPAVEIESVGGVDAAARVAAGETVDLVFLAQDAIDRLARDGHVIAGSVTPLVVSQVAAAVADPDGDGAVVPEALAFADSVGMREALRAAHRVGFSTGPSGDALGHLIDAWDLRDELSLVQARPGIPVATLLATGEVDLGFQQLSELVGQPGIRILGVLPPDCAIETVFAGAVAATSTHPGAVDVLAYFSGPDCAELKRAHAFTSA